MCETCGTVCTGKFPQGCAVVWARGPVPVLFPSGGHEPTPLAVVDGGRVQPGPSNGSHPIEAAALPIEAAVLPIEGAVGLPSGQVSAGGQNGDEIGVLLAEIRKLTTSVQAAQSSKSADRAALDFNQATEGMLTMLETLPDRLARAMSAVLTKQHELLMNEVHQAIQQLTVQTTPTPESR